MNQLLVKGQNVRGISSGIEYRIIEYLGGGGQGEVYRASADRGEAAVKWFFPHYARQDSLLRERLTRAVQRGAPSDSFLWPVELVAAQDAPGFGYVMGLREARYRGMAELVTRQIEPSFRALATAGFELASAFLLLHARGLCYRDISFGNVFFDPSTGQIQICDNDNVDIDGQPGAIGGTARFMAPELVTGASAPSTGTDLFSLAILLFYLLMNHHPLEGARESAIRCMDLPAMTRLYGKDPVFIFDPRDASNRPVPGLHDNALAFWPLYPQFLRDLFIRAFTAGLHHTQQRRVRESEWRAAMIRLRDSILYCESCGAENFYDPATLRHATRTPNSPVTGGKCWSCTRVLRLPPRIRITHGSVVHVVMLNRDSLLFPHHLDPAQPYCFETPEAQVRQHPNNPGIWGLANLSATGWTATTTDSALKTVPPGRSVTITNVSRIQFGSCEGEIRI